MPVGVLLTRIDRNSLLSKWNEFSIEEIEGGGVGCNTLSVIGERQIHLER